MSTVLAMGAAATEIIGSFVVGWITARQLGPQGKGEYTAITIWVLVTAWVASVGLRDSVAFFQSRNPERSPEIFTTSLLYSVVLAAIGIGVAQLLAPLAFRAQSDDVIAIARVAFFGIFLLVAFQTAEGLLSGQHRFVLLSGIQAFSSVGAAMIMGLFALFGGLSVGNALIGKFGIYVLCAVGALVAVLARVRPGRPSQPLARDMFGYGSKLTFEGLGQLGTTQLDLVILPAVLVATDIGFYAVATSTATVIYLIFGRLGQIVLPVAARRDAASAVAFIARAMRRVLVGAAFAALALAADRRAPARDRVRARVRREPRPAAHPAAGQRRLVGLPDRRVRSAGDESAGPDQPGADNRHRGDARRAGADPEAVGHPRCRPDLERRLHDGVRGLSPVPGHRGRRQRAIDAPPSAVRRRCRGDPEQGPAWPAPVMRKRRRARRRPLVPVRFRRWAGRRVGQASRSG